MKDNEQMNDKIKLRGNICSCSGVWFTHDLPESDPSRCPFCGQTIEVAVSDEDELLDTPEKQETYSECAETAKQLRKEQDNLSLTTKICKFCANEIFFKTDDAPNATHCPYCEHELLSVDKIQEIVDSFMGGAPQPDQMERQMGLFETDISQLTGKKVKIIFKKSLLKKADSYILLGIDPINSMIRINRIKDNKNFWKSLSDVDYITEEE